MVAGVSSADPNAFAPGNVATVSDYTDIGGKTLYAGSLAGACVLVIAGQSLAMNIVPTAYVPTHSTVANLNIYDGAVYGAHDPLLGCSSLIPPTTKPGNFAGRLADAIITSGAFTTVVLVTVAVGGTKVGEWSGIGGYGTRITAALSRLSNRGLAPTAILWAQGESDNLAQTPLDTYASQLGQLIANSRVSGYRGPWFVCRETWIGGVTDAAIQNAQVEIVDHAAGIWAGPDTDSLDASYRQADNTHLNDAGAAAWASLWLSALQAYGSPF